jgi:hypothetical protein
MNALIMGGGKFYEILSANSGGALPSRRTVDRQIKSFDIAVHEGEVNTRLLPQVLTENQLPFRVSLAEDATSVVAIREYDINSNRIFGFSLPLSSNGTNNFKNKYCSSSINNPILKKQKGRKGGVKKVVGMRGLVHEVTCLLVPEKGSKKGSFPWGGL